MSEPPQEVEAKLVGAAPDALAIAGQLEAASELGSLVLGPAKRVRIHDVYLDTPGLALAHWRGAMRIRRKDDDVLLTVKGPALSRSAEAIARPELEAPFTQETIERALAWIHAKVDDPRDLPRQAVAMDAGIEGFEVIHERRTSRVKRLLTTEHGQVELEIDRATFTTSAGEATLVEIEVEAMAGAGVEAVRAGVGAIRRAAPALRSWTHSKLSVGLALESLAPELADLLVGGVLSSAGLDRLDAALSSRD